MQLGRRLSQIHADNFSSGYRDFGVVDLALQLFGDRSIGPYPYVHGGMAVPGPTYQKAFGNHRVITAFPFIRRSVAIKDVLGFFVRQIRNPCVVRHDFLHVSQRFGFV
ncbi:hypothetical protein D1872_272980 [compost metagenome]